MPAATSASRTISAESQTTIFDVFMESLLENLLLFRILFMVLPPFPGMGSEPCQLSYFLQEGTSLHANPPPWWSVPLGTHNAITCGSLPITVCSQYDVGSEGRISLVDKPLWDSK